MDMPLLAVNPSASARLGMDLNGVPESEAEGQSFERHLDDQNEVKAQEPQAKSESTKAKALVDSDSNAMVVTDEESAMEVSNPLDAVETAVVEMMPVNVVPEEKLTEESEPTDLSRLAVFLASASTLSSIDKSPEDGAERAEDAMTNLAENSLLNNGEGLQVATSLVGQQQGSDAASLSHDVKEKNVEGQSSASEADNLSEAEQGLAHLFGSPKEHSENEIVKSMSAKDFVEPESIRPKTLKSMVDTLWIEQSVKNSTPSMEAVVSVQASDSLQAPQVTRSFAEDLKPMLDQMRASKSGGEMIVSLRPGDLGQVRVEIQVQKNDVQVSLFAEKPQAREILQSQWNDLKNQLSNVGLKLQDMSVSSMSAQSSEKQKEGGHQRQPEWNSRREKNEQADFEESTKQDRRDAA